MAGGRMHTFHSTPLYPPLFISYRNHQKSLAQTWAFGKLRPTGQIRLPVLLFRLAGTYRNLNSHHELSGRPFFSFRDHGWQWFKKKASMLQNWNEKQGENLLFWRSHSHVELWSPKKKENIKKSSPCFPTSVRPAASTVFFFFFSKFGLSCQKFVHLWSSIFQSVGTISFVLFY